MLDPDEVFMELSIDVLSFDVIEGSLREFSPNLLLALFLFDTGLGEPNNAERLKFPSTLLNDSVPCLIYESLLEEVF